MNLINLGAALIRKISIFLEGLTRTVLSRPYLKHVPWGLPICNCKLNVPSITSAAWSYLRP